MDAFISFLVIAFFCFAAVLWLKRGESKYRLDKTKLVDGFIEKNNIWEKEIVDGIATLEKDMYEWYERETQMKSAFLM